MRAVLLRLEKAAEPGHGGTVRRSAGCRSETGGQPTAAHSRAIEIRLGSGRSVFVEPGFEAAHLRAVLAVLETRA